MFVRLLFCLLLLWLLLLACQPEPDLTPTPTLTPTENAIIAATATPTPDNTAAPSATPTLTLLSILPTPSPLATPQGQLTLGLIGDLTNLDPLTDLNPTLAQVSPLLFVPLNQVDPATGRLTPALTDLAQISADNLTITYTLVSTAVTVADIQASLARSTWPEAENVRVAKEIDVTTLALTLNQPDCSQIDTLGQLPISLPAATEDIPASSGPFVLETWLTDTHTLRLKANPTYHPAPALLRLVVRLFVDEAAAWSALQAGELDVLPLKALPSQLPLGYHTLVYPAPAQTFISFNHLDEVMALPDVRQALSQAFNPALLLTQVLADQGLLAPGPLHPQHWAAEIDLLMPQVDLITAGILLDQAGLRDQDGDGWRDLPAGDIWQLGLRVEGESPTEVAIAYHAAAAYRQLGIRARAEVIPFSTLLDDLLTHDYQVAVYTLPAGASLNLFPVWHSQAIEAAFGLNLAGYNQPLVDDWFTQLNQVPGCDADQRRDLAAKIQQQITQDYAQHFLFAPNYYVVVRDGLQGVSPGPYAPVTWNAVEWFWRE